MKTLSKAIEVDPESILIDQDEINVGSVVKVYVNSDTKQKDPLMTYYGVVKRKETTSFDVEVHHSIIHRIDVSPIVSATLYYNLREYWLPRPGTGIFIKLKLEVIDD